ncbi:hypothetical protein TNCV_950811 [Trichonephila clavipes]|nr:hypothetical protein TNCV_950811 [Trichonephila clavipes]
MIVYPKERTTSKGSLIWEIPTTYSSYSTPDCTTFLEIRVLIHQLSSVSALGCYPEDVTVPYGVSPKHPIHVLWDLNPLRTLLNPFEGYFHFPVDAEHQQSGVAVHCHR